MAIGTVTWGVGAKYFALVMKWSNNSSIRWLSLIINDFVKTSLMESGKWDKIALFCRAVNGIPEFSASMVLKNLWIPYKISLCSCGMV